MPWPAQVLRHDARHDAPADWSRRNLRLWRDQNGLSQSLPNQLRNALGLVAGGAFDLVDLAQMRQGIGTHSQATDRQNALSRQIVHITLQYFLRIVDGMTVLACLKMNLSFAQPRLLGRRVDLDGLIKLLEGLLRLTLLQRLISCCHTCIDLLANGLLGRLGVLLLQ